MLSAIEDYLQTGLDEIMKVGLTYYMSEKSWPNLYSKFLFISWVQTSETDGINVKVVTRIYITVVLILDGNS